MADTCYDIDKMAEIIIVLTQWFGKDRMIKRMIERLIRSESDCLVPPRKSAGVLGMEQLHSMFFDGSAVYLQNDEMPDLDDIIIDYGLPIEQAVDMCFEAQDKEGIKNILEEIKNNLVSITKTESKALDGNAIRQRAKGASGFYWEEAYKECHIKLVDNPTAPLNERDDPQPPLELENEMLIEGIRIPLRKDHGETIQDFVKRVLHLLFDHDLIPDVEIERMLDADYCKETFHLYYPIIQNDPARIKINGYFRYWKHEKFGRQRQYWACSQWWVNSHGEEYQRLLAAWIRRIAALNN